MQKLKFYYQKFIQNATFYFQAYIVAYQVLKKRKLGSITDAVNGVSSVNRTVPEVKRVPALLKAINYLIKVFCLQMLLLALIIKVKRKNVCNYYI